MRYFEHRFSLLVFAACFVVLFLGAPWMQAWMSQLELLSPPYEYMLNADFYLLSCRIPGVLVWVLLALSFYSINVKVCKVISTRVSTIFFKLFFISVLFVFFALTLPVIQILVQPFNLVLYDYFDVASVCSRQSSFYWNLWIYAGLSYFFSAIFSWWVIRVRPQSPPLSKH